jgi:hypothetical protein
MDLTYKPLMTLIITIIMFKSTQCLSCYACDPCSEPIASTNKTTCASTDSCYTFVRF